MGAENSKIESIVFRPPNPPAYREDEFQELIWIPQWNGEPRKVPAIWLPWRESTQTTVLFSHDYGEDLGSIMTELQMLRETLHVNVVGYDYSGFGLSKSPASESACNSDAISVLKWLVTSKGVPTTKIILLGRTLGTGPTLTLACTTLASGALAPPPAPVVVVSSPALASGGADAAATLNQLLLLTEPAASTSGAGGVRASGELSKQQAAAVASDSTTASAASASSPPNTSAGAKGFFGGQRAPRSEEATGTSTSSQPARLPQSISSTSLSGAVPPVFAGVVLMAPMLSVLALKDGVAGSLIAALPPTTTDMFENGKRIEKCGSPLFITYASSDELVPAVHAQKLSKKVAASRLWRLLELKDTHHNLMYRSDDYLDAMLEFVRYVTGAPAAPATIKPVPVQFSSAPATVVGDWLRAHELSQYSDVFLQEGYYDMASIRSLRETDSLWERIDPAHRSRLHNAIEQMHKPNGNSNTTSAPAASYQPAPSSSSASKEGSSPMRAVSPIRGKMPSATKTTPAAKSSASGSLGGLLKNVTKKIAGGSGGSDRVSSDGGAKPAGDQPFPGIQLHSGPPQSLKPAAVPGVGPAGHSASVALGAGASGMDKHAAASVPTTPAKTAVVVKPQPPPVSASAAPASSAAATPTVNDGTKGAVRSHTTPAVVGFQNSPKWPGTPVAPTILSTTASASPGSTPTGSSASISRPAGPRGGIAGSERRFQRQRSEPSMHQLVARGVASTAPPHLLTPTPGGSGSPAGSYSLATTANPRLAAQIAEVLSRDDEPAHRLAQKIQTLVTAEPLPPAANAPPTSTPDSRKRFTESLYKFRTEEHQFRAEVQQHQQQKEQRRSGKMNVSVHHINQSLHELQSITAARVLLTDAQQRLGAVSSHLRENPTAQAELKDVASLLQNLETVMKQHESVVQKLTGELETNKPAK